MEVTINEDRAVFINGVAGTQNENKATTMNLIYPTELTDFAKQIVFITPEGTFYDTVTDDTYIIKNNITKYKRVRCYIVFFNSDGVDFRSAEFTLKFNENHLVEEELDEEEVNELQTLITTVNSLISTVEVKINEVKEIEEIASSKDYENLVNKPSIEGVELVGDKTFEDLGLVSLTSSEIEEIFNS